MSQLIEARGVRTEGRPRWRVLGHALAFGVCWPAFAYWFGPRVLTSSPMLRGVDGSAVRLGMLWSLLLMWREVLAAAALLTAISLLAAALGGGLGGGDRTGAGRARQLAAGLLEGAVVALALLCGVALELPAALNHPALSLLHAWPVSRALWTLGALTAVAAALLALPRRSPWALLRRLAATGAVVALGLAAARGLPDGARDQAGRGARIVLGLDSISQDEPIAPLRALTAERGGTWYEEAVTPGLFTNAVWTSIVTARPVHETGVFFTFQNPEWSRLPRSLPVRAKEAGLRTCAFFSDQFTMQLGADLPFDENHSGPRGWLQAATSSLKDASWFLPIALAHLPPLPGAATPANQGGTFTYSLRRELSEVLSCGAHAAGGTLVLAHLDYLHQARYPGLSDLDPDRRARVLAAPVGALVDESIHWQYPEHSEEPVGVYRWKLQHLQRLVREAVESTGVLDPALGNRLIVLSDHGPRTGLTPDNFGERRFWNVPLVTFGVAPRDPTRPISLLDVPALLGLPDPGRPGPAPAVVEYTIVSADEMKEMVHATRIQPSGRADLDPAILRRAGIRLKRFEPFAATPRYAAAPVLPPDEPAAEPAARSGG